MFQYLINCTLYLSRCENDPSFFEPFHVTPTVQITFREQPHKTITTHFGALAQSGVCF